MNLCEVCKKNNYSQLCDYATGSGIVTSIDFRELTSTCDKKLCRKCAIALWANCEVCPDHAVVVKKRLEGI